jgi:hypothetical protein
MYGAIQMDAPLKIHIEFLEQRLNSLSQRLMEPDRTRAERNKVESEIRAAELALVYYKKAFELEKQIS